MKKFLQSWLINTLAVLTAVNLVKGIHYETPLDLVVASLGGNNLYLFPGDGKGSFGAAQTIGLSGGVTALAAENLLRSLPYSNIIVGVSTAQSSSLLVFSGSDTGMTSPAVFPLKAAASNIVFGDFILFAAGPDHCEHYTANFPFPRLKPTVEPHAVAQDGRPYPRSAEYRCVFQAVNTS